VRKLAAAITLIALTLAPAAAHASAYTDVLHVYEADGSIPPCKFSSVQLAAALKGIDTYGQQYFADFTNAVQSALAARASGACSPGRHAFSSAGASARSALPPSITSATNADLPAPILLMAALGVVIGSALGLRALARGLGWEPAWAAGWRHAWGEASYRLSGGWAQVRDWWRSGR
jgi:hypothetical protein